MEEDTKLTEIRKEGDSAFGTDKEKENSSSSSEVEKETKTEDPADQGENSDQDKLPFHQHPRWLEREEEWKKRFNDSESRHQEDLRKIREEFGQGNKKPETEKTISKIPAWFGGSQEQWDEYRADRDAEIAQAKELAIKEIREAKTTEEKQVAEATDYMQTEMAAIEKDPKLNPTQAKIDPNKLLKIVLDNDLIDSKGRWNYRAGFRIMAQESKGESKQGRKELAGAMNSDSKGEADTAKFKTNEDFKKNRPW